MPSEIEASVRTEITDPLTNRVSTTEGTLSVQSQQINAVVSANYSQDGAISSMQGQINVQANQISLVVNGDQVNAASIIAGINNDNSYAKIRADKVDIQGFVTFSDLTDGYTTISGSNITTGRVDMQYIGGDNIYFDSGGYINALGGGLRFGYGNSYVAALVIA